tara:strand:- start:308 stop:883 length:576 start_codon:yes stop_codon:yes gene_type:complete
MRILSIITLLFLSIISYAQIERLTGPRFGITIISNGSSADILNEGVNFDEDENNGYGNTGTAFTTQYGWQWETRFADGGENIIGIVEWVTLIAGLEKGMFLPSASSLVGIRTMKGFEVALGPNISLAGVGLAFAAGYNFKSGNLNIPVNIAFVPGINKNGKYRDNNFNSIDYNYNTGNRISLLIGFNMNKK